MVVMSEFGPLLPVPPLCYRLVACRYSPFPLNLLQQARIAFECEATRIEAATQPWLAICGGNDPCSVERC